MDEQIKEAVENTVNTVVETGLQKAADTTTEIAQKALETVSEPETNWGVKMKSGRQVRAVRTIDAKSIHLV